MVKPVPVFGRPVLIEPARGFDGRHIRQWRGQQLCGRRNGPGNASRVARNKSGNWVIATIASTAVATGNPISQRTIRNNLLGCSAPPASRALMRAGKFPLHEQCPDFSDAEVTAVAFALAHDVEQDRKFGIHHRAIPREPVSFAACEIRIHVGRDLAGVQPAFGTAARVGVVRAEGCEALDLGLIDLTVDAKDTRADAMFVEWPVAQSSRLAPTTSS